MALLTAGPNTCAIAAAMMRLTAIVPFLARLSENELQSLHERLGCGFLSQKSMHSLSQLAAVTGGPLLARKSLTEIAQLVGSSDPMDATRLAEDCEAYRADRHVEQVLARYRDTPAPPPELFLSLLDYKQPCSWLRAGLFELWLRAEPKPKGGRLLCGSMDDELPVLDWLLREQAAVVFQGLVGAHHKELEEFVSWFLAKARPYTGYFTGGYKFGSFNMYVFGRPRYAAWSRLAQEVQGAATSLGIPFPESVRLPTMPDLEKPTQASLDIFHGDIPSTPETDGGTAVCSRTGKAGQRLMRPPRTGAIRTSCRRAAPSRCGTQTRA
jgi:hypothetical protein